MRRCAVVLSLLLLSCGAPAGEAPRPAKRAVEGAPEATLVVLGSGTPVPDPERAGPAHAVVMGDEAFLFDAGAGVLRRLEAARARHPALAPERVRRVFLTHLHSDHVLGLDELLFGAWVLGRERPLEIWGPPGTAALVDGLRQAYAEDRRVRTEGLEGLRERGSEAQVREVSPGVALRTGEVEVRAFAVPHGSWTHAYGWRIDAGGRVIVLSGDTATGDPAAGGAVAGSAVVEACDGCDLLVHEVCSAAGLARRGDDARAYHGSFHTTGLELGRLAARARPSRLVLTHVLFFGESADSILGEVREGGYAGELFLAADLAGY